MKRILVAGLLHESNTFNPIVCGEADFSIRYGNSLFSALNKDDSISGIVDTLKEAGCEVIPTVYARAVPNGEVSLPLYLKLKEDLLKRAREATESGTVDALCLSLHGSMRIREFGEAEGDLLESLREIFSEQPIVAALDMHASFSEKMFQYGNAFVGYKCAPHTDCYETGAHAARMTVRCLDEGITPVSSWKKIPFLVAGEQSETNTEPMKTLISSLRKCETQKGILAASYLMGFPWADNGDNTVSVLVVSEGDREQAERESRNLADLLWSNRDRFTFHTESRLPEAALDAAFREAGKGNIPVYLSDSGDNPTAGSTGDCSHFLKLILDDPRVKKLSHPLLYAGFYDPEAYRLCEEADGEISIKIGGAFDTKSSAPLTVTGSVKSIIRQWGEYRSGIALFSTAKADLIIAEKHIGFTDPRMFRDLGLMPEQMEIIVCKLGYLTAAHRKIASKSIMALTEGCSNEILSNLPYRKISRPVYPLDKDIDFTP